MIIKAPYSPQILKQKDKALISLIVLTLLVNICSGQNPIISQRYTADPTGLEYNGRLYLWTSHDIDGQARYYMNDITSLSTKDLLNWTDHGEVFNAPEDSPWATQAWAPSMVERNGEFFLYFGDANRAVGVASSEHPNGPFKDAKGSALITKDIPNADVDWLFDPTVFIDDGQAYCVFGGGPMTQDENGAFKKNARIIKLGEDMISTVGPAITIDAPGFYEGGYIHKRSVDGVTKYYFSYFNNNGEGMNIDYMMSDDPMEGWEYKGTILEQPADNYNNTHASVFPFKDKWYIGYHTRKIATDRKLDKDIALRQRSVSIDELTYKDDYTIQKVTASSQGPDQIGAVDPYIRNEAETMAAQSYLLPGIETAPCKDGGGCRMVTAINNGDWIKIGGVDFGSGATKFSARVATPTSGGTIEVRLDSENGPLVGKLTVNPTGGWEKWETKSCEISGTKAKHDLYLKFTGEADELFNLNWWMFNK